MRIAIIGAGITGLTAGLRLGQKGHQTTIFEKEKFAGGLSASFQKKSWQWPLEDFFHHFFVSDAHVRQLASELQINQKFFFKTPKTAIFWQKQIIPFDSPLAIFQAPFLSWPSKLRVALTTTYLKATNNWQGLEKITATKWLPKYYGQQAYQNLWEPLLTGKFADQKDKISMAWFWARIKKRSQRLGYFQGGTQTLINALVKQIKTNNGTIKFNQEVKSLKNLKHFDKIIITTPANKFFKTKLPPMIGALNLVLELKEPFLKSNTYWLNINDPAFPFVAVVEHTNFIDKKYYGGRRLVYVGGYYPQQHRYFKMTKAQIFKEWQPYLKRINPDLSFIAYHLSHNLCAQPIMPTNYSKLIINHYSPIPNVHLANMQMVYPWDRGINYAIAMGESVANEVEKNS